MPIHDWTRVDAGIFHDFRFSWIAALAQTLNSRVLPADHYALIEPHGGKAASDVLALTLRTPEPDFGVGRDETDLEFYRRKQDVVAVRREPGDDLVAVVDIVSRANKSARTSIEQYASKAAALLGRGVHLLVLDLQPPTARDPDSIHGVIWDALTGRKHAAPADAPLTLASFEAAGAIRAHVEPIAVGDALIDMPLFLRPGAHVPIPLEATYQAAWEAVPRRWRDVIAPR